MTGFEEPSGTAAPPSAAADALLQETRLVDHLLQAGKLDERGLQRAQRAAGTGHGRLADILSQLGLVSERDIAEARATLTGLPLVARGAFPARAVLAELLSPRFLRDAALLPLEADDAAVMVAMADPEDRFAIDAVALATGRRVVPRIGIASELQAAIARLHAARDAEGAADEAAVADGDAATDLDIDRLRDLASEAPVVRLVDQLIARAVVEQASDIHIEPFEDRVRVRYRIDGRLQEVDSLLYADKLAVSSRLKIMAGLNIAERRQPQDGRIRTAVDGRTVDIRVATAPTLHGESLVLRLLRRDRTSLDLGALGFDGTGLARLLQALQRPHGLLLVTGPTGSGKTTTLYAALDRLNSIDRKILTVEDPIEYQMPGANQVQVNAKFGLGFAQVLRAFLRHDPDIIMVGEIRDSETAEIAVHAALTGHLVLATLHTNDAPSAVTRLIDMGVEDFLLTSTLIAAVGQRLVRTLCRDCRAADDPPIDDAAPRDRPAPHAPFRPVGCERCHGTGFLGRTTIAEVMTMTDALRPLILDHAEARTIRDRAVREGMQTMLAHGLEKIGAGITTLDEVLRATTEG